MNATRLSKAESRANLAAATSLAKQKALFLAARTAYYDGVTPLLTDADFDKLEASLRSEAPNWSKLKAVGVETVAKKFKRTLDVPMGSLDKFYPEHERQLAKWVTGTFKGNERASVSSKLDGSSIQVAYEAGVPVRMTTRGSKAIDGFIEHLPNRELPQELRRHNRVVRENVVVRFEAVVPHSIWSKHYRDEFDSARIMASAVFNRLDVHPSILKGHVHLVALRCLSVNGESLGLHDGLTWLDTLGFRTVERLAVTIDALNPEALVRLLTGMKKASAYECDGIVVSSLRAGLESTSEAPSYAKAFKLNDENDAPTTTVEEVEWKVSRTGRVVPRARLKPVQFDGVTVTYATMNNVSWMQERGLGAGATVRLVRSGEIIPKIIEVVKPARFVMPVAKDFGVASLVMKGADLVVGAHSDESAHRNREQQFAHAMAVVGVEHLSSSAAKLFAAEERIKSPLALLNILFGARAQEWCEAVGISGKIAARSLASLPKTIQASHLMYASGHFNPGLGRRRFEALLAELPSNCLDGEFKLTTARAQEVLGNVMGQHASDGFAAFVREYNRVFKCKEIVRLRARKEKAVTGGKLSGQTVYLTGYRDAVEVEALKAAGAVVASSFNKDTTILLHRPTGKASGKLEKARSAGIRVCQFADLGV